jgi:hypothetical protein
MAFPIDCALKPIAAIEKHLGIDKRFVAMLGVAASVVPDSD